MGTSYGESDADSIIYPLSSVRGTVPAESIFKTGSVIVNKSSESEWEMRNEQSENEQSEQTK